MLQALVGVPVLLILVGCAGDSSPTPTATPMPETTPTEIADTTDPGGARVDDPMTTDLGTGTALVWGSGSYGVVLVHGAIYDAASWTDQAERIAAAGFSVVAIEHATADDTRAAMDYLRREHGVTRVALIGASAGTGPVLSVASAGDNTNPAVDLVVILAGSGNVDDLSAPSVLFISAENDAAASAERMMEATSGDPNDLVLVPGSAHAQALFNQPEGETVLQAILARLAERQTASP